MEKVIQKAEKDISIKSFLLLKRYEHKKKPTKREIKMFTKEAFHELKPDLIIHLIPLGRPPRTTILSRIVDLLKKDYPALLVNSEYGLIALNTEKIDIPR